MGFRPQIDIHLSRNHIRVTNRSTGRTLERAAAKAFSSSRMLVADGVAAERLLHEMIVALEGRRRLVSWPTAIIHPMELCEDGLSPVEKQAIVEIFERLGFSRIEFAA